jgi:hypothetical protein
VTIYTAFSPVSAVRMRMASSTGRRIGPGHGRQHSATKLEEIAFLQVVAKVEILCFLFFRWSKPEARFPEEGNANGDPDGKNERERHTLELLKHQTVVIDEYIDVRAEDAIDGIRIGFPGGACARPLL